MKQSFFAYLLFQLKTWIYYKRKSIQLWVAIRIADQKQRANNRRYYVLPDYNGRLIALCRDDVKQLKRLKIMDKRVTHIDLMKECFYYTPLCLNNAGSISDKERLEKKLSWMKYCNS